MERYDGLVLQRVNAFFKKFESDNGEELFIIEPGYILNKYAYLIWRMMDEEIRYEDLLERLFCQINGSTKEYCEKLLNSILEKLYKRQLLLINGKVVDPLQYFQSAYLAERDFLDFYQMRPITQIDIVLTTKCNFRCKHCYIKKESLQESETISIKEWKKVLYKLSKRGLISISVTGGEPLTYIGICDVLDYANKLGMKIQLLTNGALIDETFVKKVSWSYVKI